ncbi:MAG: DNA helicase RecQ [Planctomycetia bacterium]|nr:DNA helicase RecQ [Planctomycetia bacterium]
MAEFESSVTSELLHKTLLSTFGYKEFRPYQEQIVQAILMGQDVLAVMPTGGGKSLCYQLPAVLCEGVCVVISPLLSLMKDQVDSALQNGINAATINSTTSTGEWRETMQQLERGRLDLLYISPERFNTDSCIETLQNVPVGFFAVDEAHCISQWGHNFRSDYLMLSRIIKEFPNSPVAAFTATATERVSEDIIKTLGLRKPYCVRASFDRPNLLYQIEYKESFHEQLMAFLQTASDQSGVIYRATRRGVEETTEFLKEHGYNAAAYHAGLSDSERVRTQEKFARDETPIIVATVAFGMGIDKSNVRFVVHGELPHDIESYYQETGRAGRDGATSRCLLFYGYQDIAIQRSFLSQYTDVSAREAAESRLVEMIRFVESDGCRRANLLRYFGEVYRPASASSEDSGPFNCGACDHCLGLADRIDATIDAQKALSAMARTNNRFGIAHLTNILVGQTDEKIERYGHNRLPTFGVGADRSKRYWAYLIRSLLTQGYATLSQDKYPVPQTTALGWDVMRGKLRVTIRKAPDAKERRQRSAARVKTTNAYDKDTLGGNDRLLFERLRVVRMELARAASLPPYMIFTDKTLIDMVYLKPQTEEDFLLVNGVGQRRMENYGKRFLEAIRDFMKTNSE